MANPVKTTPAKTVDEYLDQLPATTATTLEKIRKAIMAAAPKAEEFISYRIPVFKISIPIIAFAAFPKHCSLITMSYEVMKEFADELSGYDISGTTIRFPIDKPLPAGLVKKLVKARIKENEEKLRRKKKNKS